MQRHSSLFRYWTYTTHIQFLFLSTLPPYVEHLCSPKPNHDVANWCNIYVLCGASARVSSFDSWGWEMCWGWGLGEIGRGCLMDRKSRSAVRLRSFEALARKCDLQYSGGWEERCYTTVRRTTNMGMRTRDQYNSNKISHLCQRHETSSNLSNDIQWQPSSAIRLRSKPSHAPNFSPNLCHISTSYSNPMEAKVTNLSSKTSLLCDNETKHTEFTHVHSVIVQLIGIARGGVSSINVAMWKGISEYWTDHPKRGQGQWSEIMLCFIISTCQVLHHSIQL